LLTPRHDLGYMLVRGARRDKPSYLSSTSFFYHGEACLLVSFALFILVSPYISWTTAAMVEIYTDGACSGNPGAGGWGVLLRIATTERELCGGQPATTNNRMELLAVIEALQFLTQPVEARIYTDSQYVQKGISVWIHQWKQRGWKTASNEPVKNEDLWRRLEALTTRHRLEWHWVRGHAGHPENERADALARAGLEQARQAMVTVERNAALELS